MGKTLVDHSKQTILVAGMHRSGTSALTKTLSILGADLPKNLMPSMIGNNEKGFWESRDLERIHDSLLESAGSMWDDWSEFNPEWFETVTAKHYKKKLLRYLKKDFKNSPLFIIKDPRICRFLPIWFETSQQFDSKSFVIIPFRHPLEVANSLKKRDGMAISKGLLLWLRHVVDAVHYSKTMPRAFVSFDNLLNDWDNCVNNITQQTGIKWPKKSALSQLKIEEFLDVGQRHQTQEKGVSFTKDIPSYIEKAYMALLALEKDHNDKEAIKTIESIRANFTKTSSIYAKIAIHEQLLLQQAKLLVCKLEKENSLLNEKLDKNKRLINELQEAHARKDQFLTELQEAHTRKDQQIGALQEAHARKDQQIGELQEVGSKNNDLLCEIQKEYCDLEEYYKSQLNDKDSLIQNATDFIKKLTLSKNNYNKYEKYLNQKTKASILQKFLKLGAFKKGRSLEKDMQLILESGKFDPLFYLIHNPDVLKAGVSPLEHFCVYGWKEGRNPNANFNLEVYCEETPEVLNSGINPFVYYLLY